MASEKGIQKLLESLDVLRLQRTAASLKEQKEVDTVLTPELLKKINAIRDLFAASNLTLQHEIDALEASIKRQTTDLGRSVRGSHWQAVWSKPRVSWNTDGLEGFGAAHPEILAFRSEGKPTVSLRAVTPEKDEDPT